MISDNAKIGTGLLALGIVFLFLGMLFLFDSAMLALGDILFLVGLTLTIGKFFFAAADMDWFFLLTSSLFAPFVRAESNPKILLQERSNSGHHFLFWRCPPGDDSMAYHWNDLSIVWSCVSIWSILSHCGTVDAGHTHHWRYSSHASDCQLFCELWRKQYKAGAGLGGWMRILLSVYLLPVSDCGGLRFVIDPLWYRYSSSFFLRRKGKK
jgi:hypothetical protein